MYLYNALKPAFGLVSQNTPNLHLILRYIFQNAFEMYSAAGWRRCCRAVDEGKRREERAECIQVLVSPNLCALGGLRWREQRTDNRAESGTDSEVLHTHIDTHAHFIVSTLAVSLSIGTHTLCLYTFPSIQFNWLDMLLWHERTRK